MRRILTIDTIRLLLLLFFALGCNQKKDTSEKPSKDGVRLSYIDAFKIVHKHYLHKPDTLVVDGLHDSRYVAAIVNEKICILQQFAGSWQEIHVVEVPEYGVSCMVQDMQWVEIDSAIYFYYQDSSHGNAAGGISFNLYSLSENKQYSIGFGGLIGQHMRRMEPISNEIRRRPSLLKFLETRIASRTKPENPGDFDLQLPKNAVDRWKVENPDVYHFLKESYSSERKSLTFAAYKEDLSLILPLGSKATQKENALYRVVSFFKSVVLCYDRKNNLCFVLWAPELQYNWVEDITFLEPSIVALRVNGGGGLAIDIKQKKLIKLALEGP